MSVDEERLDKIEKRIDAMIRNTDVGFFYTPGYDSDVCWLFTEVVNLQSKLRRYEEALEFYAEQDFYRVRRVYEHASQPMVGFDCVIWRDNGERARKALHP